MESKSSQIKRLLEQGKMSFAKIAKIVGCGSKYVSIIKKEFDNPKEKKYGNLKKRIKELYAAGYSSKQMMEELGCVKSTISYSLNERNETKKVCTLIRKIHTFKKREKETSELEKFKHDEDLRIFVCKIATFKRSAIMVEPGQGTKPTKKNVLEKFSGKSFCSLCGTACDFKNSKSYSFDHYIPRSRGGDNSLENMQLLCMECNMMKHAMLQEEFLEKCKMIVEYNKL